MRDRYTYKSLSEYQEIHSQRQQLYAALETLVNEAKAHYVLAVGKLVDPKDPEVGQALCSKKIETQELKTRRQKILFVVLVMGLSEEFQAIAHPVVEQLKD